MRKALAWAVVVAIAVGAWLAVRASAASAATAGTTVSAGSGVDHGTRYYERVVTTTGATVRTVRTYDAYALPSGATRTVWATVRYHRTRAGTWGLNTAYRYGSTRYHSGRVVTIEVWVANGVSTTEVDTSGHDGPTSITTARVATVP